ncbi:hypothetical protein ACFQY4_18310 [Catellatospora bangladeshensis]|uniref:Uncharacterized protein n=1 Tax=Catellatospora bangladeshensis TaxID=310355 RepID=A0A8J3JG47_9ACTN|nr:hypothetical protein [Catellatospora bangladeshensis]GIF82034.1 hypothetical protein Cba03nite_33830 [Catellatospora bangladeshensis]
MSTLTPSRPRTAVTVLRLAVLALTAGAAIVFTGPAQPAHAVTGTWELIDSTGSYNVAAADIGLVRRNHRNEIHLYTGAPPTWQILDNNPRTVQIAASGANIYQRHGDGRIWKYLGVPITGWQQLDANPATADIVADGNLLYQRHYNGSIFRYTGSGWQLLDANPATRKIAAAGGNLYQIHDTGSIFKLVGAGWQLIDTNPASVDIVADGQDLYQMHRTGAIYKRTPTSWAWLDGNPATAAIAAHGGTLVQRHHTGSVFRHTGAGWELLDSNPATAAVAVGPSFIYQQHTDGRTFQRPLGRRNTAFQPAVHGFKFVNTFVSEPISGVKFGGLCGGMSYASLDYYFRSMRIPQQNTLPPNGSTLQSYIYNRQVNSIVDNADKWAELLVNPFGWRTQEFFNWGLQDYDGGRLQELRWLVDTGRPAPLGLFAAGNGGVAPHHQVVAIGYDMGRYRGDLGAFKEDLKIFVSDPNYPGERLTLVPSPGTTSYRYLEHPEKSWMTYFVDRKYQVGNPPSLP